MKRSEVQIGGYYQTNLGQRDGELGFRGDYRTSVTVIVDYKTCMGEYSCTVADTEMPLIRRAAELRKS